MYFNLNVMLNSLIKEYGRVRLSCEFSGKDATEEIVKVLQKVNNYLSDHGWKCNPSTIEDNTWAMCMFFEMFAHKIGGAVPAMMCYYFSTLVANDMSIPEHLRLGGNKYRAFVVFKNMDNWDRIIMMARLTPIGGYNGNLDEGSFFDILLLGDVYQAWDVDPNSTMLANLKRQAPNVARNHPDITRQQAIVEGNLAHEAVFRIIEPLVVTL